MNYLTSSSAIVLTMLMYELSGNDDFAPEPTVERDSVAYVSVFHEDYVPFNQPVFSPIPGVEEPRMFAETQTIADGFEIVKASVSLGDDAAQQVRRDDIRIVIGDRVNMREGPSTDYSVLATLPSGTEASVALVNDEDWARVRILETGETGWMAAWLLSD